MKKLSFKQIIFIVICIIVVILIQVMKMNTVYTTDFKSWAEKHTFATATQSGDNITISVTSISGEHYEDCEVEVSVEYSYKHWGVNVTSKHWSDRVTIQLDESGEGKKIVNARDIGVNSERTTGRCSVTPVKGTVQYKK